MDSNGTKPDDTDPNSTNRLLNAFANHIHREKYGFHPYVWEIANMVRAGVMGREEGMVKIYSPENETMVEYAKMELETQLSDLSLILFNRLKFIDI